MGSKKSKIISRDAFIKSFVEAEVVMRRNLAARIDVLIETEDNEDVKAGLVKAREIVYGKVETE